jgi:hypothetical protein
MPSNTPASAHRRMQPMSSVTRSYINLLQNKVTVSVTSSYIKSTLEILNGVQQQITAVQVLQNEVIVSEFHISCAI